MRSTAILVLLCSCGGTVTGDGSVALLVSGEQPAKTGYPDADAGLAFVDGWSLTYDKVLASVGNVRLADSDGTTGVPGSDTIVADLHLGDVIAFTFDNVAARRFDLFSFDVLAPIATSRQLPGVSPADVTEMTAQGWDLLLEGHAVRGDTTLHFRWGFAAPTHDEKCQSGVDAKAGLVIQENARAQHQVTLHLDHIFYDHLGSHEDAHMRFDAIAAMARNGTIAFDDLAQQRIFDLRDASGMPLTDSGTGQVVFYDPYGADIGDENLKNYLLAASRSEGHFDGEGGCDRSALP